MNQKDNEPQKLNGAIAITASILPLVAMSVAEANKAGASGIFEHKYSSKVKVYTIGKVSKEMCSGPHVKNTGELGHFKIKKEKSSSAGVRRIKAVLV